MIGALLPCLFQLLHLVVLETTANLCFQLCPGDLFSNLLLLGSLESRLEASLHADAKGSTWTLVLRIGSDFWHCRTFGNGQIRIADGANGESTTWFGKRCAGKGLLWRYRIACRTGDTKLVTTQISKKSDLAAVDLSKQ